MTVRADPRMARLIMDLRNQGIRSRAVLRAIEQVPRELFINPALRDHAFDDNALPIECGQTISQPFIVAYMTEKLDLDDRMKVLEIGTGSGYQAAVLSHLCRRVYSIERYRTLAGEARARFDELGLTNITTMIGDGLRGWPAQAPFDRIIVTAAADSMPETLIGQLKTGGKMILPLKTGDGGMQKLVLVNRDEDGVHEKKLIPVRFVPLVSGVAREL